jgi:hypothetical protein
MGYLETLNWETIKNDLQKGVEQGLVAMKKGALIARKKAEALTEEGKRQYQLVTLKAKVHKRISDLGARVYALMGSRAKNPALDAKVRDMVSQLKKLESQVIKLEKKEVTSLKKTAGSKARKKTATR